jgi:DNA-binding NarL/FixJ family response regulator
LHQQANPEPEQNSSQQTRQQSQPCARARPVALSYAPSTALLTHVVHTLRSGALGYLLKNDDFKEVMQTIHVVTRDIAV